MYISVFFSQTGVALLTNKPLCASNKFSSNMSALWIYLVLITAVQLTIEESTATDRRCSGNDSISSGTWRQTVNTAHKVISFYQQRLKPETCFVTPDVTVLNCNAIMRQQGISVVKTVCGKRTGTEVKIMSKVFLHLLFKADDRCLK